MQEEKQVEAGENSDPDRKGGGFLAIYEIGVIQGLLEQAPEILKSAQKIYGASSGSIIAAAVVCELSLDVVKKCFYGVARDARRTILGPFSPSCNLVQILQQELCQILPENSHQMATGRLYVSLTRLMDGRNVVVSEYSSKEELIQALICSCFVPVYGGFIPPSFRGVRYVDGGFTNLQPHSDLETAITVSPFTGEIDICPRDCPAIFYCLHIVNGSIQISLENLCRIGYALFPPSYRVLNEFCSQGYRDAILFLHRNNIFEISYLAKTVTFEFVGVFSKEDLFHASEEASCQKTGLEVLNTSNGTTSKDYSDQPNAMDNVEMASKRLLQQLPLHCPKAVLHTQKRPGFLNSVTRFILQHLVFMEPPTRVAWSFCKRLEQLRQLLGESWFARQFKRTKRWFVKHNQDKELINHVGLKPLKGEMPKRERT
ncbi:omega-hydroxyceramide transacylase-like isoform X2 [Hemicordylus capensis]|uniref:omega-hydroxyceramide transacylase-like isoform X2 n=1 Tax=Hemicordylus capensis TaxID=884348 RepID=UPI0023041FCF|nr:omega-hydroxyceramide transacylase-like isoform X2 [Hemicordylus capensis]